jgi:hypothetical protein
MCLIFLLIPSFVSESLSLKIERATNSFNDSIEPICRISSYYLRDERQKTTGLPIY